MFNHSNLQRVKINQYLTYFLRIDILLIVPFIIL